MGASTAPSPVLVAASIGQTAAQQDAVIQQLSAHVPAGSGEPWYQVAKSGFNVIDQKCDDYLSSLYAVDKQQAQTATLLHVSQNAGTAILKDVGIAGLTIDILAQIFGIASAFNDAAAKSYLLSIGPAAVTGVVYNLQVAFRDQIDSNQASGARIASEADAVHQIQSYIRICSPVFIEAHIGKYIAESGASTSKADRSSTDTPNNESGIVGGPQRSANIKLSLVKDE